MLLGEPRTCVGEGDLSESIPQFGLDRQGAAVSCNGISCVEKNVHENLLDLISIDEEHRDRCLKILHDLNILERGLFFNQCKRSLDQCMNIPLFLIRLSLPGKVEEALHDI